VEVRHKFELHQNLLHESVIDVLSSNQTTTKCQKASPLFKASIARCVLSCKDEGRAFNRHYVAFSHNHLTQDCLCFTSCSCRHENPHYSLHFIEETKPDPPLCESGAISTYPTQACHFSGLHHDPSSEPAFIEYKCDRSSNSYSENVYFNLQDCIKDPSHPSHRADISTHFGFEKCRKDYPHENIYVTSCDSSGIQFAYCDGSRPPEFASGNFNRNPKSGGGPDPYTANGSAGGGGRGSDIWLVILLLVLCCLFGTCVYAAITVFFKDSSNYMEYLNMMDTQDATARDTYENTSPHRDGSRRSSFPVFAQQLQDSPETRGFRRSRRRGETSPQATSPRDQIEGSNRILTGSRGETDRHVSPRNYQQSSRSRDIESTQDEYYNGPDVWLFDPRERQEPSDPIPATQIVNSLRGDKEKPKSITPQAGDTFQVTHDINVVPSSNSRPITRGSVILVKEKYKSLLRVETNGDEQWIDQHEWEEKLAPEQKKKWFRFVE